MSMSGRFAYMDWSVENRCIHCNRTMRPASRNSDLVAEAVHASKGYCHRCYSRIRKGTFEKIRIDWSKDVICPGCSRILRLNNSRKGSNDARISHYGNSMCKRCYKNCSGDPAKLSVEPIALLCVECAGPLPRGKASLTECSTLCHNRRYRRNNPEIIQSIKTRRRYSEISQYTISSRDLHRLVLLSDNKCSYCKTDFTTSNIVNWDHVVPLSRGGKHSIGNLAPSCRKCNTSKGNRYLTEWKKNPLRF